jgi:hypothetical protein
MNEEGFLQGVVVVKPSVGVARALAESVVAVLIIDMVRVAIATTGTKCVLEMITVLRALHPHAAFVAGTNTVVDETETGAAIVTMGLDVMAGPARDHPTVVVVGIGAAVREGER